MTSPALRYLIRMFPQLSETFIANEILELEKLGFQLRMHTYRKPSEVVRHKYVTSPWQWQSRLSAPVSARSPKLLSTGSIYEPGNEKDFAQKSRMFWVRRTAVPA